MEKTKKQNPQMNQNQSENTNLQEKQFEKEAMKVSTVSIVVSFQTPRRSDRSFWCNDQ